MSSLILAMLLGFSTLARYEERFISAPGAFPANHGSTILEIKSGNFLACWYAGSREGGKDVQIYCSDWQEGAETWSTPRVAVAKQEKVKGAMLSNKTLGNPVLVKSPKGRIWLIYTSRPFGGWVMSHVDYKFSDNNGKTWSGGQRLVDQYGHLTRSKALWVGDQKLILPLYTEMPKQSYTAQVSISGDELRIEKTDFVPGKDTLQPSLVILGSELLAFMRNYNRDGVLMSRWSPKQQLWGQMTTLDVPNPNSAVDTVARSENEVLMVSNTHAEERSPLSLSISQDGLKFRPIHHFEDFAPGKEYSYPAMIKVGDTYHVTYTYDHRKAIKHVIFDEAWLSNKLQSPEL